MHHRSHLILCLFLLLALTACSAPTPAPTPSPTASRTPAPSRPASTHITPPTDTPRPLYTKTLPATTTPTRTPTATFGPIALRTATPAPAAQCPPPYAGIVPTPTFVNPTEGVYLSLKAEDVLDFLNRYGAQALRTEYEKTGGKNWTGTIQAYRDLTNDGVPELVIGWGFFYIFGCENGQYRTLYEQGPDGYLQPARILDIMDANRNGIPELKLLTGGLTQGGHFYDVIEWDGQAFQSVMAPPPDPRGLFLFVEATGDMSHKDIDGDGIQEYIVDIGIPVWETYTLGSPWREERQVYKWNGKQFALYKTTFSAPEYRFQAVQDGDRAAREGDYDKALDFYQQAIFNDQLKAWSPEQRDFVNFVFMHQWSHDPTPTPPLPDPKEYDSLAAYARYRIMLLHLSIGWVPDANVVYDTLQKKFPDESSGYIYTLLAEKAWAEYAQSGDLSKACGKVLEFAAINQDAIIYYISGSGFPGNHGLYYTDDLQMICPY